MTTYASVGDGHQQEGPDKVSGTFLYSADALCRHDLGQRCVEAPFPLPASSISSHQSPRSGRESGP